MLGCQCGFSARRGGIVHAKPGASTP
jgi:hypothetical protein